MKLPSTAWVRLPLELLRQHGLTKAAAAVCAVLVDRATSAPELYDWIAVSAADIAADTGYNERTVRRSLADLEALALIEVQHNKFAGSPNRYRLTGCVELCGAAAQPKIKQQQPKIKRQRSKERGHISDAELQDYLSLSNRFKSDADEDAPLEGQLEF